MRALFSQASGLYVGEQNRRYFEHFGMPAKRLFPAPHCVDNAMFREGAAALRSRRRAIRAGLGIDDAAPVVLFCGKLIDKKQPLLLVEAFARVRHHRPCWLLLVGTGELEGAIRARATPGIPNVLMPGFLNQTELPAAYAAADLLVLPSGLHETWGLVVNEAMNFGLPIVVSDKVGCAADLVRPGWNGFVVESGNVGALARRSRPSWRTPSSEPPSARGAVSWWTATVWSVARTASSQPAWMGGARRAGDAREPMAGRVPGFAGRSPPDAAVPRRDQHASLRRGAGRVTYRAALASGPCS